MKTKTKKNTKPKHKWPTREEKAATRGKRFAGTRQLLTQYGFKVEPKERTDKCNALGCKVKLKDSQNRKRWCAEHAVFTQRVRNLHCTYRARGQSLKKPPPGRMNVRAGRVTVMAHLLGVNPEKALKTYHSTGERKLAKKVAHIKAGKKAAKVVAKAVKRAAAKVVKAVHKPLPKKVAKPSLKAMLNGKGADAQAAVAAHMAAKKEAAA